MFLVTLLSVTASLSFSQSKDKAGTKDYALIARVAPVFHIIEFEENDQGSMDFPTGKETSEQIKGKKTHWEYASAKGAKLPTKSAIFTHYMNKVKSKGGSLVFEDINDNACTLKMPNPNNKEQTVYLMVNIFENGANYTLTIIE